jgi:hypothetical protein
MRGGVIYTNQHAWHRLSLGDATLAADDLSKIETEAKAFFEQAGNPSDMALFVRHESEQRLHCELVVYYSPKAFPLAKVSTASPWAMPCPVGLSMLAGKTIGWQLMFPNYGSGQHTDALSQR